MLDAAFQFIPATHPDCKNVCDKTWRRCATAPSGYGGSLNGKFIRQSAKTRQWAEAEACRLKLEDALAKGLPPFGPASSTPAAKTDRGSRPAGSASRGRHQVPTVLKQGRRVTVEAAVKAYLADATSRGVAPATHTKLTTIFRKQFLSWTQSQGFAYLDEIDLDALLNFRSAWKLMPLWQSRRSKAE